ncbi:MAG TPA: hypothetical protein DD649_07995 [Providencia sp.]|nr:hypothetical protein [Providencia sp.]
MEHNDITYVFKNESYSLTKDCISELKQLNNESSNTLIYIQLNKTPNCAEKLNTLFTTHVNEDVTTYFKKQIISKTHIASSINSESGYRMLLPNEKVTLDIIQHYNNLN